MDYLDLCRSHLERLTTLGTARYGPDPLPMWMASLDVSTGRYPENDARPAHIPKRVYRNIDAPRGVSLYWDQPSIVAAHLLGEPKLARAADDYVRVFLDRCVAKNGIFLWGNHYYFDAFVGKTVRFNSGEPPVPVDFATEEGDKHETRPLPPAWETFWRVSPEKTERCIRALGENHVFDAQSGGFNRHADRKREHAFMESGGILCETLAWLYQKTGDESCVALAERVAGFSFNSRHPQTGLLENDPTSKRWDKLVCTTEAGLWAGSMLRASAYSKRSVFAEMGRRALSAFLERGFDESTKKFFGRLRVADGGPDLKVDDPPYPYMPKPHSDIWEPLFPAHDYPLSMAQACVDYFELTNDVFFAKAIERWATHIRQQMPARGGSGGYAEHYGRAIHFLCSAADATKQPEYRTFAEELASDAVARLLAHEMFRGHPGEDRYDAVDGVGMLMLGLIRLERGKQDLMGFGF